MTNEPLKILIAESHPLIAMELERIINEVSNCLVVICHGDLLGQHLADETFDFVFIDAAMAEKDFTQQFVLISETGARVVFLSSYMGSVQRLSELGPAGVIEKPFDEELITDQLRAWLSAGS